MAVEDSDRATLHYGIMGYHIYCDILRIWVAADGTMDDI